MKTTKYAKYFNTRSTPQSMPIPGKVMIANEAGGYTFPVDKWERLIRVLLTGSESGTYYTDERKLTLESAQAAQECIAEDGLRVVKEVVEMSVAGRAPKNSPALFVLALCASSKNDVTRAAALASLPGVARTASHLFEFIENVQTFRSWGRGLRKAVGGWYNGKDADRLAYQVIKYRNRNGWTHRDVLRSAHPKPIDEAHKSLYRYITHGSIEDVPALIATFERLPKLADKELVAEILNSRLPWEAVPTEKLTNPDVWLALLPNLPMTALLRNLGRMSAIGAIGTPVVDNLVAAKLLDTKQLRKDRIHPIGVLNALNTYSQGHGEKGHLTWDASPKIIDALNDAFYLTMDYLEPTGKRILLGIDISGSMAGSQVSGIPNLSLDAASAAMAVVLMRQEPLCTVVYFNTDTQQATLSPRQRLDDIIKAVQCVNGGGTDCAQPILYATGKKLPIDAFVILTDNQTWAGNIHPSQALAEYKRKIGIDAKLISVAMANNASSITGKRQADETTPIISSTPNMTDAYGFDTDVPQLITSFIRSGYDGSSGGSTTTEASGRTWVLEQPE